MAKRQAEIPGTERKTVKELNDCAEAYVDVRDKRMKLTEREGEMKERLVTAMRKHGLEVYRDDDASPPLLVVLKPGKDNVRVTTADGVDGSDDDGE